MISENTKIQSRRTARILTVACGLLFFTFSFVYLYVFQEDLLEAFHYSLSEGKTQFSPLGTALVISALLVLLRLGVNVFLRLKGAVRELAYFPSCLLLGVITSVGYEVYEGKALNGYWIWLLPLLLVAFVGVAFIVGRFWEAYFGRFSDARCIVNGNLFILLMLCMMTMFIGNTNIHFHRELAVEKALKQKEYGMALDIGKKQMDPSHALTALRAYALSKEEALGERLFEYPQLYGAAGLLLMGEDADRLRLTGDSLYTYLGEKPASNERPIDFFNRICREDIGSHVSLDYYLSALLLERQLSRFVSEFNTLYLVGDSIPRYYEEALFLHDKLNPEFPAKVQNESLEEKWNEYIQKCKEVSGDIGEGNLVRRAYGNTYWWYYQYK